jgi:glycosyltransferase involved in cell wall biosynthesis
MAAVPAYQLALAVPVYNHQPLELLEEAYAQLQALPLATGIYLLNDGSPSPLSALEKWARSHKNVYYQRASANRGRAATRNALASWADAEYCHFLDDQAVVDQAQFWAQLWEARLEGGVVYGPAAYTPQPEPGSELRWRVGRHRELRCFPPEDPYGAFKGHHFLAHRRIWPRISFAETLRGYGHEDTLFGLELEAQAIPIKAVNLPVYNTPLDPNPLFLQKTRESLDNLRFIEAQYPQWRHRFKLLQARKWLLKIPGLRAVLRLLWPAGRKIMEKGLLSPAAPLWLYDLYRLFYLLVAARSTSRKR